MRYWLVCDNYRFGERRFPDSIEGLRNLRILLVFEEKEITYDASNITFTQGDIARIADKYGHDLLGSEKEHLMHQWKDIAEDGNIDRVRRIISLAVSQVSDMLYKYTRSCPVTDTELRDCNVAQDEYVIAMQLPPQFSQNTAELLLKLIHEYIVASVLEDWAGITYPEAKPLWAEKKQLAEIQIRQSGHRTGVCHHKVRPSLI